MSGYTLNNEMGGSLIALTTTARTQIIPSNPTSGTAKRLRIVELELSAVSVPNATDCQIQGDLVWNSGATAGTATTAAPQQKDSGAAIGTAIDTAITSGKINFTGGNEPTTFAVGNSWWFRGFNQRSGVLWQAAPGYEIVTPSATGTALSVGPALRALSTNYTGNVAARMDYMEL
jgi:hypothetical protein